MSYLHLVQTLPSLATEEPEPDDAVYSLACREFIPALQELHDACFPIKYGSNFYENLFDLKSLAIVAISRSTGEVSFQSLTILSVIDNFRLSRFARGELNQFKSLAVFTGLRDIFQHWV